MTESVWQPTLAEIGDLLQKLGLSPPETPNDFFSVCEDSCDGEELSESYECTQISVIIQEWSREELLKELLIVKNETEVIKTKNSYLHDYLVEHFTRKQMPSLYTNLPENENLLDGYTSKLFKFDETIHDITSSKEQFNKELSSFNDQINAGNKQAQNLVDEIILRSKNIGKKCLATKVENLILKQLEKIQQISNYRLHNANLRSKSNSLRKSLKMMNIQSPNLTKGDYDRLCAERFYYQEQLTSIEKKSEELAARNKILRNEIREISLEIKMITNNIEAQREMLNNKKGVLKLLLHRYRKLVVKVNNKKKQLNQVLTVSDDEFKSHMDKIYQEQNADTNGSDIV